MSVAASLRFMRRLNASRANAEDVTISLAADFLSGGTPSFARVFDRKGAFVGVVDRLDGETLAAFRLRAHSEAQGVRERLGWRSAASDPQTRRWAPAAFPGVRDPPGCPTT